MSDIITARYKFEKDKQKFVDVYGFSFFRYKHWLFDLIELDGKYHLAIWCHEKADAEAVSEFNGGNCGIEKDTNGLWRVTWDVSETYYDEKED